MKANSLNGKDLMLWIAGKVIALSKSCNIDLTANKGDANTKDDGAWDSGEIVSLSWTAKNESVDSADANRSNDLVYDDLFDAMINKSPIVVTFGVPTNASDDGVPTAGWTAPTTGYSGKALITSLSRSGAKGSNASVSISLDGVGSLSRMGTSGD